MSLRRKKNDPSKCQLDGTRDETVAAEAAGEETSPETDATAQSVILSLKDQVSQLTAAPMRPRSARRASCCGRVLQDSELSASEEVEGTRKMEQAALEHAFAIGEMRQQNVCCGGCRRRCPRKHDELHENQVETMRIEISAAQKRVKSYKQLERAHKEITGSGCVHDRVRGVDQANTRAKKQEEPKLLAQCSRCDTQYGVSTPRDSDFDEPSVERRHSISSSRVGTQTLQRRFATPPLVLSL